MEDCVGMGCRQLGEGAGEQEPASAGERGDGELGAACAQPVNLLLGVLEFGGDGLGGPDHDAAGLGEGDPAGAAHDDRGAEAAFQCGDVLGDGRGSEVESCRRLVEAAALRNGPQDTQSLYINQQYSLMRMK
jgi:hypothetical protein